MSDPLSIALVVASAFVLAGLVKGVIGVGLPTVAMGLMSLVFVPAQAAAILVIPSLVTNIWQALAGPYLRALLPRMASMLAGIGAGALAGAALFGRPEAWATAALGVALIVYGVVGLSPLRFSVSPRAQRWAGPVIGIVTGVVTAATGVFVLPAGPYLVAIGLERDELVQALGISFTVSTVALAAALWVADAQPQALAGISLLAIAPALVGMALGQWIRRYISAAAFRVFFFVGLLLLGAHLALRTLL